MVVNSLFYGAIRYIDVMFDGVVCFYCGFVYDVFIQAFSWSGACAFDPTIALVEGVCCAVGGCDFLCFLLFGTCCLYNCSQPPTLMLFLLKILARGLLLGKCLEIKFWKFLPILDVMHLL